MKTAVSIPDNLFADAERLASRLQTSRSELYARALAEFVARHDEERVTSAMNATLENVGTEVSAFSAEASQSVLRRVEW